MNQYLNQIKNEINQNQPKNTQTKNPAYNDEFYNEVSDGSYNSAKIVLPKLLEALPKINSVVDFGCGIGTWLAVFKELGVREIKGYDGNWVNENMLKIPAECFYTAELDKGVAVNKKYDLAISLEVAEHLPASSAALFIESLTKASDIVLFSAAIPYQGGTEHINEQWLEYWNALFNKCGYVAMDFLRQQIWKDMNIQWWYRQNIILFVKKEKINDIKIPNIGTSPLSIVHPNIYLYHVDEELTAKQKLAKLEKTEKNQNTTENFILHNIKDITINKVHNTNLIQIEQPNIKFPFYLRENTSDINVYSQVFADNEYNLKNSEIPEIIVDGGANIGLFAILIKNMYPKTKIICVEPDIENFQLLKKNLEFYDDIYFENCGIWNIDTKLKVYDKYQIGKWAMVVAEDLQNGNINAISINSLMKKYELSHIDFLKLDIETSEKQLFSNNYENWLPKIKTIIIELHDWLEEGCSKPFFEAINKTLKNYKYYTSAENTIIVNLDKKENSLVTENLLVTENPTTNNSLVSNPLVNNQTINNPLVSNSLVNNQTTNNPLVSNSTINNPLVTENQKTNNNENPLVSVIIPLYNYEKYIVEAIESVIKQTYKNWELIIVDDCSTDDSYNVAANYIKNLTSKQNQIFLHQNEKNSERCVTRNTAIKHSKGKYIFPLDADDMLHPDALEELVAKIECEQADFVQANQIIFKDGKNEYKFNPVAVPALYDKIPYYVLVQNSTMYKREIWEKVGGYSENVPCAEDWDIIIKFFRFGFRKGVSVNKSLFYYRIHSKNDGWYSSSESYKNDQIFKAKLVLNNKELYSEYHIKWANVILAGNTEVFKEFNTLGEMPDLIKLILYFEKNNPNYASIFQQTQQQINEITSNHDKGNYKLEIFTLNISETKQIQILPFYYPHGLLTAEYKPEHFDLEKSSSLSNHNNCKVMPKFHKKRIENNEELVSVIMPLYNYGKYLAEAVESVIEQTYKNWELIIVDDCSTDDSLQKAIDLAEKYSKYTIYVYSNPVNLGLTTTRNAAIKHSNGKYIFPLDSDDVLHSDALEELVAKIEYEQADFGQTDRIIFQDGTNESKFDAVVLPDIFDKTPYYFTLQPSTMYKREILEKVGGYNENLLTYEDWEIAIRVFRFGFRKGIIINKPLFYYRKHGYSLVNKGRENDEILKAQIILDNKELYNEYHIKWANVILAKNADIEKIKESKEFKDLNIVGEMPDLLKLILFFEKNSPNYNSIFQQVQQKISDILNNHKNKNYKLEIFTLNISETKQIQVLPFYYPYSFGVLTTEYKPEHFDLQKSSALSNHNIYKFIPKVYKKRIENNEELVSVIIPLYNYEKYIVEAVESVIKQTYKNWEIIIVDDCSTDNSLQTAIDLAEKYSEYSIFVYSNLKNLGLPTTRNAAIKNSNGKYILPHDADNILHPNILEEFVAKIKQEQADFVYSNYTNFQNDDKFSPAGLPLMVDKIPYYNHIPTFGMFKKKILEKVGYYDENLLTYEDWELWIRIFRFGFRKAARVNKPLFFYRIHGDSLLSAGKKNDEILKAKLVLNNKELYSEYHIKWANEVLAGNIESFKSFNVQGEMPHLLKLIVHFEKDNPNYNSIIQQIQQRTKHIIDNEKNGNYKLEVFTLQISETKQIQILPFYYPYSLGILTTEYKPENFDLEKSSALSNHSNYRFTPKVYKKQIENNEELVAEELVTVIIPLYNYGKYLAEAVESVIIQTYKNWELIIVNDCSTDDSLQKAVSLAEKYSEYSIFVYSNPVNLGVAATRNVGIKNSNGKYILPLDADDILHPDILEELISRIKYEQADFVYSNYGRFQDENKFMPAGLPAIFDKIPYYTLISAFTMFRKEILEKIGYYDENLRAYEDWELYIRMFRFGFRKAARVNKPLFFYRIHGKSLLGEGKKNDEILKAKLILNNKELYSEYHIKWANEILAGNNENLKFKEFVKTLNISYEMPDLLKLILFFEQENPNYVSIAQQIQQKSNDILNNEKNGNYKLEVFTLNISESKQIQVLPFYYPHGILTAEYKPECFDLEKSSALSNYHNLKFMNQYHKRHIENNEELVSVIIPSFNYGKYITETIESVINQTYKNWELIIVDDYSSDDSLQTAIDLAKKYPDFSIYIYSNSENFGFTTTRNAAIKNSNGKYIFPLDSDDVLHPNILEELVAKIKCEQVDFAQANQIVFKGKNEKEFEYQFNPSALPALFDKIPYYCLQQNSTMYKWEIWEKVGGYNEEVRTYEDWEFYIRFFRFGFRKSARVNKPLFFYRKHGYSLLEDQRDNDEILKANIILYNKELYSEYHIKWANEVLAGDIEKFKVLNIAGEMPDLLKLISFFEKGNPNYDAILQQIQQKVNDITSSQEKGNYKLEIFTIDISESKQIQVLPFYYPHGILTAEYKPENFDLQKSASPSNHSNYKYSPQVYKRQIENNEPLVTVIIPLYNYGKYLTEAVNSVIIQTYKNWEIIIVDDCSTDDSLQKAVDLAKNYSDFSIYVYSNPENLGLSSTRNAAIKHSNGKYIFPLDADNMLHKDILEEFVARIEYEQADFVYSNYNHFQDEKKFIPAGLPTLFDRIPYYNFIPTFAMCRKEILEKIDYYDENIRAYEDWELWIRIFRFGFRKAARINKLLFYYRIHGYSLLSEGKKNDETLKAKMILNNKELYSEYHIKWANEILAGNIEKLKELNISGEMPDLLKLILFFEKPNPNYDAIIQQIQQITDDITSSQNNGNYKLEIFTLNISESKQIQVLPFYYPHGFLTTEYKPEHFDLQKSSSLSNFTKCKLVPKVYRKQIENNEELVSIIIPLYNQGHLLEETIKSVTEQTYKNWEIIIVNDCSTDDSLQRAMDLAKKYSNFSIYVYSNPKNYGLPTTRNAAIKHINGKYFIPLDSDDKLEPIFIEKCMKVMQESGADIVYTDVQEFGIQHRVVPSIEFAPDKLLVFNYITVCSLVKKRVWEKVGGYDENFRKGSEDWNFWINSMKNGFVGKRISEPLFLYRKSENSMYAEMVTKNPNIPKAQIILANRELYEPEQILWAEQVIAGNPKFLDMKLNETWMMPIFEPTETAFAKITHRLKSLRIV